MPIRAIKKLDDHLCFKMPTALVHSYRLGTYDCLIVRHFDKEHGLIREINETTILEEAYDGSKIGLYRNPVLLKFGFTAGEFIEVIF